VTGGAGFIGSHLVDELVERGDQVVIVDDLSFGEERFVNPKATLHRVDIRDPKAGDLIRNQRPAAVWHLAAQISVSRSVKEPGFDADVNVLGSLNLLVAAQEIGARFLFASTGGALYGEAPMPTPESAPTWPRSPYGIAKLSVEHYLFGFRALHQLGYAALRFANVYGPRQNPHGEAGVVAIFARRLVAGEKCLINGSGDDTRDYIHVRDVVSGCLAALDSVDCGHFNLGTARQTSTNRIFELLAAELAPGAQAEHGPPRPGDLRASCLDHSLMTRTFGWEPRVSLADGIRETAAWFREDQSTHSHDSRESHV
jgi:UDP-glucose 4-epimerase